MARELGWDTSRKVLEYQHAAKFLSTMNRKGKNPLAHSDPLKLQETENRVCTNSIMHARTRAKWRRSCAPMLTCLSRVSLCFFFFSASSSVRFRPLQ